MANAKRLGNGKPRGSVKSNTMTWKQTITQNRLPGSVGAALTVVVGLAAVFGPWQGLTRLSYDLPFVLRSGVPVNEAVIVYMDEKSLMELKQDPDRPWDRALHARLLKELTAARAKAVVFDILFDLPGNPQVDLQLAEAMAANGKVVLAAFDEAFGGSGGALSGVIHRLPTEPIRSAARGGSVDMEIDADRVIRKHAHPSQHGQTLPQAAADLVASVPVRTEQQRWLNYYGPSGTIPHLSYADVVGTKMQPEFFSGKVVFVGSGQVMSAKGVMDDFSTPFSRWHGNRSAGVEIQATAFLNLVRGDWLVQLPLGIQASIIIAFGLVFGFALSLLRPWRAANIALAVAVAVTAAALGLVWQAHIWFAWLPICLVQIPLALVWGIFARRKQRRQQEADVRLRSPASSRDSVGRDEAQFIQKAAEQAKALGLSTSQLESPRLQDAVIVRFPQGTSKPGVEVLLDRDSGKLIQMSVAATKVKPEGE